MKQAKVLNDTEMKRLLAVVDVGKHAGRNRAAVMLSYLAGFPMREPTCRSELRLIAFCAKPI